MRVANLDMTDSSQQCPGDLVQRDLSGTRACAAGGDWGNCSSAYYGKGVAYSKVCGRVSAYYHGSPGSFSYTSLDDLYVDGVSITHGSSPRHHIWTFAASQCPCNQPPSFVEENYFCDGGSYTGYPNLSLNPLWDGENCSDWRCCTFNNPPWFHRQLPQPTTDDIEMRVCRLDEKWNSVVAEGIELYVQ